MSRQIIACVVLACVFLLAGCHHKVQNPMAGIDSKQPDKGLYDRAMDSMKHGRFQEARSLLETLINTYPESEYIARAKLALGDSWYAEGGSAAWKQAEVEYKDFQTFFPNMPESAEAQLKVATMHYRQMEKPDRDFGEAMRAAEEYKNLIQQYPDSALVPEAKQRLREVQEVLAERQYRIAHFYYLRDNLAAAQARLQSLVDSYPLYSGVDEALFELGNLYEKEAAGMRRQNVASGAMKEKMVAQFQNHAVETYTRIVTRYPAMARADDARKRLQALNAPVPTPTAEAIAESKAEEQSRDSIHLSEKAMGNFKKHPNVARAAKVGDPNMSEEVMVSAASMVQDLTNQLNNATRGNQQLGIEAVGTGTGAAPGPNQPPPGANEPAPATPAATQPAIGNSGSQPAEGAPPTPAPPQVNEVQKTTVADAQNGTQTTASGTHNAADEHNSTDSKQDSTSKKKGKKGLRKLIPF